MIDLRKNKNAYRFNKEEGRWYIDLPNWTGGKAALQMVAGADEDWYLFLGGDNEFYVDCLEDLDDLKVISLSDFEKLAEEYSGNVYDSIEDILAVFKQAIK
jgi:hypothetical protein